MSKKLRKEITLEDWRPYKVGMDDFKIISVKNYMTFKVPSFLSAAKVLILMDSDWEVVIVEREREEEFD